MQWLKKTQCNRDNKVKQITCTLVWVCTENGRKQNSQKVLYMNLETKRLRGRPRNRWQDEVREVGRLVGGKGWKERVYNKRGMEEAPENGKESSHSAHANGMNE